MHGSFAKFAGTVLLAVVVVMGCDDEGIGFDVSTSSSSTIEKVDLCPPDIGISLPEQLARAVESPIQEAMSQIGPAIDSEMEKRDTAFIKHVYLKRLSMRMDEPPSDSDRRRDNTLGFLSKVEVYVSMDDKEELLAESAYIPEDAVGIDFRVFDVDLVPYLDNGFTTRVKVTARYCPAVDMPITVHTTTRVKF